jgi:hypothetical protein
MKIMLKMFVIASLGFSLAGCGAIGGSVLGGIIHKQSQQQNTSSDGSGESGPCVGNPVDKEKSPCQKP